LAFNRSDNIAAPFVVINTIKSANSANFVMNVNSGAVQLGGSADNAYAGADVKSGATLILAKTTTAIVHALGVDSTVEGGGTLKLAGSGGDQIANVRKLTVNSGGVFDLNSVNETIATLNLAGTGISGGGALINSTTAATSILTAGITLTGDCSMGGAGNLTLPGAIGGGGFALTKTGAGTLTLGSSTTLTGAVSVAEGTLLVSGNISGASGVSVEATATLGGSGSITSNLTVTPNGFLAPGNSTGTLAAHGSVVINGTLKIELDGATADRLTVTGSLDVSDATLAFTTLATPTEASYVLASYTTTLAGAFTVTGKPDGYSLQYDATNKQMLLVKQAGFAGWITRTDFANGAVPAGKQGPSDDPDHDGVSNLVEYAIAGMDPTAGNAAPGTLSGNTLRFNKRLPLATDLAYAIEESKDLGVNDAWAEVPTGPSYVNDSTKISYTLPAGPTKNFLRLKLIANP
jgi:autotransporter-associated beta strand protein